MALVAEYNQELGLTVAGPQQILEPLLSSSQSLQVLSLRALSALAHGSDPLNANKCAGDAIDHLLTQDSQHVFAIDCFGVRSATDHAFRQVTHTQSNRKGGLLLFNCAPDLVDRLKVDSQKNEAPSRIVTDRGVSVWFKGKQSNPWQSPAKRQTWIDAAINDADAARKSLITNVISQCFTTHTPKVRLPSTPLLANGSFDLWKVICKSQILVWLADEMDRRLEFAWRALCENPTSMPGVRPTIAPRLLAVNVRGAVLAYAMLRFGGGYYDGVEVIDRFGPRHEPVERYESDPFAAETARLLVTDYVVGGTELKLAEASCVSSGGSLPLAVCVGSMLSENDYGLRTKVVGCCRLSEVRPEFRLEM